MPGYLAIDEHGYVKCNDCGAETIPKRLQNERAIARDLSGQLSCEACWEDWVPAKMRAIRQYTGFVTIAGISMACEVADTLAAKTVGMQKFATAAPHALWFPYEATDVSFHMGATKFPLDAFFTRKDASGTHRIVKLVTGWVPGDTTIVSCERTDGVLETEASFAKAYQIKIGDTVVLH